MDITEHVKTEALKNIENNYPKLAEYLKGRLSQKVLTKHPTHWERKYSFLNIFRFGKYVPKHFHTVIEEGRELLPNIFTVNNKVELDKITSPILEVLESMLNGEWSYIPMKGRSGVILKYEELEISECPNTVGNYLCDILTSACNHNEIMILNRVSKVVIGDEKYNLRKQAVKESRDKVSKIIMK